MLFHPCNVGREVVINEKNEIISYVRADKKAFRVKSEENGPVVRDYDMQHIQSASSLTVSYDEGKTWRDLFNVNTTASNV